MSNNFYSHLEVKFATQLQKTFCTTEHEQHYTYEDLHRYTAQIANYFASLKIKPGDRILVQIEKSPEALMLYLACVRYGAIFIPVNPAYTQTELAYFIADATPSLIICDSNFCESFAATTIPLHTLGSQRQGNLWPLILSQTPVYETYTAHKQDTAVIIYTSGTTGKPKGAMLTHENLLANTLALIECWQFTAEDILLHALPVFHIHGLLVAVNPLLLSGACILLVDKFSVEKVCRYLLQCTVFMGVPTYYTRLLSDINFTAKTCKTIRAFFSGSAPLLPSTFEQFQQRTGHTIVERYGMSETGINTSNPLFDGRAGTVGKFLTGVNLRIVDVNQQECTLQKIGYIQISGANIFKGYWQQAEKTQQAFTSDGFFITGDMGYFDQDNYLIIAGRDKDLIISGGLNIYPKEIELCLNQLAEVKDSAVIGIPHDDFGEAVIALVILNEDIEIEEEELLKKLKINLAGFKIPKRIIFVSEFPVNVMGKVQKNVLREWYKDLFVK